MKFPIALLLVIIFCVPVLSQQGLNSKKIVPEDQSNQSSEVEELLDFLKGKIVSNCSFEQTYQSEFSPLPNRKFKDNYSSAFKPTMFNSKSSFIEFEGIETSSSSHVVLGSASKSYDWSYFRKYQRVWRFDLRDFSPKEFSIKEMKTELKYEDGHKTKSTWNSGEPCFLLILKTRNNKKKVAYISNLTEEISSSPKKDVNASSEVYFDKAEFFFRDREIAERCKKAFTRAAYLFGAKDELY